MSTYLKPGEVRCWSCKEWMSNNELENADGFCPHCDAEICTDDELEICSKDRMRRIALALLDELETAEKRIAELENDCWIYEGTLKKLLDRAEAAESACNEAALILESGERMALTRSVEILRAAGIGVKEE